MKERERERKTGERGRNKERIGEELLSGCWMIMNVKSKVFSFDIVTLYHVN